jgi:hypothetical protein
MEYGYITWATSVFDVPFASDCVPTVRNATKMLVRSIYETQTEARERSTTTALTFTSVFDVSEREPQYGTPTRLQYF